MPFILPSVLTPGLIVRLTNPCSKPRIEQGSRKTARTASEGRDAIEADHPASRSSNRSGTLSNNRRRALPNTSHHEGRHPNARATLLATRSKGTRCPPSPARSPSAGSPQPRSSCATIDRRPGYPQRTRARSTRNPPRATDTSPNPNPMRNRLAATGSRPPNQVPPRRQRT